MKRVVVRGGSFKDNGLLSSKGISIQENSDNGMKDIINFSFSSSISGEEYSSYRKLIFLLPLNEFLRYKQPLRAATKHV